MGKIFTAYKGGDRFSMSLWEFLPAWSLATIEGFIEDEVFLSGMERNGFYMDKERARSLGNFLTSSSITQSKMNRTLEKLDYGYVSSHPSYPGQYTMRTYRLADGSLPFETISSGVEHESEEPVELDKEEFAIAEMCKFLCLNWDVWKEAADGLDKFEAREPKQLPPMILSRKRMAALGRFCLASKGFWIWDSRIPPFKALWYEVDGGSKHFMGSTQAPIIRYATEEELLQFCRSATTISTWKIIPDEIWDAQVAGWQRPKLPGSSNTERPLT